MSPSETTQKDKYGKIDWLNMALESHLTLKVMKQHVKSYIYSYANISFLGMSSSHWIMEYQGQFIRCIH